MQKTRDHPNNRSGYVKEDVLKAISGFFIILAFIAVISLFAGMGGSSGGTNAAQKLSSPSISLSGSILTITDTSGIATNYNIYSNGTCISGTVANFSTIDLADLIDESGTYSITVTAVANGYEESELSNAVEYVVSAGMTTGLYDANDNLVASWDTLVNTYGMDIEKDYTDTTYKTDSACPYYLLTNTTQLANGVKLIIPDSVTKIGSLAFYYCDTLTSITIGNGVKSLGSFSFANCSSLTNLVISDSVERTGKSTFYNCPLLNYNEYSNAYYLGNEDNPYVALIKSKSTTITSCVIHENTKLICSTAFRECPSIKSITIPDSVTDIAWCAFYKCTSLTSVIIGNGVKYIGTLAFSYCPLTTITFPDSLIVIGSSSFEYCSSITSIVIPESVTSIEKIAFRSCSNLTSIAFKNTTGWYVTEDAGATSGTNVSVINATQNATYFKTTYNEHYWYRS